MQITEGEFEFVQPTTEEKRQADKAKRREVVQEYEAGEKLEALIQGASRGKYVKETIEKYQADGLSDAHIFALKKLQGKFSQGRKDLGEQKKWSELESSERQKGHEKLMFKTAQERWAWWVQRKVKMRSYNDQVLLLSDLKREREAAKAAE